MTRLHATAVAVLSMLTTNLPTDPGSDWNPHSDLQAIGRAHRLGQRCTVLVLRLLSLGDGPAAPSVEQRMLRRAGHKLRSARLVLREGSYGMGTATGAAGSQSDDGEGGGDDGTAATSSSGSGSSSPSIGVRRAGIGGGAIYSALSAEVDEPDGAAGGDGQELLIARALDRRVGSSGGTVNCSSAVSSAINKPLDPRWREWLESAPAAAFTAAEGRALRKRPGGPVVYSEMTDSGRVRFEKRARAAAAAGDDVCDECVLCGMKWVFAEPLQGPASLSGYSSRVDGAGKPFAPLFTDSDVSLLERLRVGGNEDLMIVCDACDGPYHLLCIGLQCVPDGEWFCRFCSPGQ